MRIDSQIALAGIASMFTTASLAAPLNPQYPPEVSTSHIHVTPVDKDWKGAAPSRLLLSGASLVIGPPEANARAEPRGEERASGKAGRHVAYRGLRAEPEKWMVCFDGQGGDIEQAWRLPDLVDECIVRITRDCKDNNRKVDFTCK